MNEGQNRQLLRLTTLLQLERRARRAALPELPFLLVNETSTLLLYRQALLWQAGRRGGKVVAASGVAVHDPEGPYLSWVSKVMDRVAAGPDARRIHAFGREALGDGVGDADALARDWQEWLPREALWVPLPASDDRLAGALLLVRDEPWTEAEEHLLSYLGEAYAHAWSAARRGAAKWGRRRDGLPKSGGLLSGRMALAALAILVLAGFVPVRQSVLAPAEVVPSDPTLVRVGVEGVIDRFQVAPYEAVGAGQPLFALDDTQLRNRLNVAAKARDIAQAEYLQAAQLAVVDPRAKAQIAVLQARIEQQQAEVVLVQDLLARVQVSAPHAGVAIFDDVNDWVGRPVSVGERILLLADPGRTEMEIRLPVGEALPVEPGAEVLFFLNVSPDRPVPARLERVGYRTAPGPDGVLSYRLMAGFEPGREPLRIGLTGTAKIYGDTAPFGLWVLRRPISAVRQWLGL
jgi:HlyD family secretion protein